MELKHNQIQFTMRMDSELYQQLKEAAHRDRRSIKAQLEYFTEQQLKKEN